MAIGRSLAAAALLTTTLVGCASSASEEPDDSATKPSKASKSDADSGPVQVDGGVAAPGSLTDFDCAPDGDVWSATGTLLATGTFVNETASGWQQVLFTQPVAICSHW